MKDAAVPYPGLRPFEEKDRAIFFGREAQIVPVLALLEERRFVAVVGSSGSGKSSLVLAGVIPAVREGFLRGTDAWKIVTLKPGGDPCGQLARKLVREGLCAAGEDAAALGEKLHAADRALLDLAAPPGTPPVLIVVDQFEELFSFRRLEAEAAAPGSRVASRDEAATFVRLLLRACAEPDGRVAVILTMRSDFIGDCDAFLGLPERISRCQYLVPRLDRSQLREAIERPGQGAALGCVPFTFEEGLVNRIIAEAGDRLDQLPLMQHALMRTWKLAGGPVAAPGSTLVLTEAHYLAAGGISEALSRHADAAWVTLAEEPAKAALARRLFLLLCDVHPDGKIVRRRPLLSEVRAITGADLPALAEIVRLFQSDDRNFLLPPLAPGETLAETDHLDISHEALLRQWREFSRWIAEEEESKVWLRELSQAARDSENYPKATEFWKGNDLRGAHSWLLAEGPNAEWAKRHGVQNWPQCLLFLKESRHRRRQSLRRRYGGTALAVIAALVIGGVAFSQYRAAALNESRMREFETAAKISDADRLQVIEAFAATSAQIAASMLSFGDASVTKAEQQATALANAVSAAATAQAPVPARAAIDELLRARETADDAVEAIDKLQKSTREASRMTGDKQLADAAAKLAEGGERIRKRAKELGSGQFVPDASSSIQTAIESRLDEAEKSLAGLLGESTPDASLVRQKDRDILAATADIEGIESLWRAALALGFDSDSYIQEEEDRHDIGDRRKRIIDTLAAARTVQESAPATRQLTEWTKDNAIAALSHGGRVNGVRFAPGFPPDAPLLAAACEDRRVWFWKKDGSAMNRLGGSSAVNSIAFSPLGDALAAASNGSTVRVVRWPPATTLEAFDRAKVQTLAFERHEDSVLDVEFSHDGHSVASASADRTVRVFDARTLKQLYFTSPPLPRAVTSVAFSPGDKLVVSGCDDGGVRLHTIDPPGVLLLGKFGAPARRPEFSPDGRFVIAASSDRTVRIWSVVAPAEEKQYEYPADYPAAFTLATFCPTRGKAGDFPFIACTTGGEIIFVRRISAGPNAGNTESTPLALRHSGAAVAATWSADGRWLASVGGGEVIVWEWKGETLAPHLRIKGLDAQTSHAEFSPDARLLVTYGGDHVALLWDTSPLFTSPPGEGVK